jgi:hypothetical protein
VSCIGSFLDAFSKWIDYHLQNLVHYTPTYIKDSNQIIQELKTLNPLPPQSKLFTCDAVSMYTNIDSAHGPELIERWIQEYAKDIPQDFPNQGIKNRHDK